MHHSNFVHLHLHTQYSLLDGAIRHNELFSLAKEYRMPALAMTDHGNMFGVVEFYEKAVRHGIKPIIGCETYVAPNSRFDKTVVRGGKEDGEHEYAFHLILLAKNITGYKNLCKLVTTGYLEGFYYKPRIDKGLLKEHNEGLIALSSCLHGEIPSLILNGNKEKALKVAEEYRSVFNDNRFFLELQDNKLPEQKKVNEGLLEISRKLNIPVVATNDCHYLKREEAKAHDILLCIQTGKTINDADRLKFRLDEFYFKSPKEMETAFSNYPEAIKNTIEIAERCNLELKLKENHLPAFPLPDGEDIDAFFENEARHGLEKRLRDMEQADRVGVNGDGNTVASVQKWHYFERLEKELKVVKKMGFSGYFLIVADFINYAKKREIPVGPGRGSAAGSLVAYSLGITNLDPIKHNLLFERFLNPDRISLPDIDIDFCIEGRDDVIRYVAEKYGKDNVSQIITFGQMKAKAVIRDVGRAMDIPYGEVDRIAKLIPDIQKITIEDAIKQEPRLKELVAKDVRIKELIDIAKTLEGLSRHASTHAAGVVIANKPLIEYLPLYKGPKKEDVVTTQYAMEDIEKIGLVKFDFLGLKTLTVIDKTVRLVKEGRGEELDIDNLKLDDIETYRLLSSGNTNGIFQLESSGVKELLRKLKPETFEDVMSVVALYRPGPLQSGMVDDFIKRKHGKSPIKYELPQLKDMLSNTYGVIVYQEQVMEIAKVLAGCSPGDADVLRKAMGKKLPEEMVVQREKFIEGAKKNKIEQKKAEKIFDLMANFAGYGFNKSHSAAYALIAYQTAYLKAHYPVEFMAAQLTSEMADTDKVIKYIGECRDMGIEILPPDINESRNDFTVTSPFIPLTEGGSFLSPSGGGRGRIRFGLAAIKNVGIAAIDVILKARDEGGPFASIVDCCSRIDARKVNRRVIESLIKCGAFDSTGAKRAQLMASLDKVMNISQNIQRERANGQISIFNAISGTRGGETAALIDLPSIEEWSEAELLSHEKEALGFYITSHPLTKYVDEIKYLASTDTDEMKERQDEASVSIAGIVTTVKETTTKKGDRMAFVTLEDLKGSVEVIVFSDVYKNAASYLSGDAPILVKGKVDKGEENVKLIASSVALLEQVKKAIVNTVHINIKSDTIKAESDFMEGVKKLLTAYPGNSPVYIHLLLSDREVVIAAPDDLKVKSSEGFIKDVEALLGNGSCSIAQGGAH
ncbi:MAG TPA: DNA polymerase III subunit alpha [Deltaproteobacteria bacterium]|nr:MAG: DNA polymerase III subunit alpha [Deltaproteobacteria bacterium GWD2_42_10]OGQ30114.1 MAG: DNA polymerase III subunit alpha [Deltaproteobacteria bacterium RIFCSPHIGHO2_02_FULL_42_44]OGQ35435.1 MAG: DNA polymerase III subunit alpha [Deltaproteobacteria bacterium RIFCSPLOWO2_02_FULL_42_39]OGQ65347.1 MAG: DNA polymerase III subunit alpha [Deltaproteobacteria bacterium RIFCSPLOWO2_12_FULL_42_16]OGQ75161.1 MAG: DNA polymerase III subunit alpha [Deltaproteobacteria bacterium RIFOXYA2_FULL_42_